MNDRQGTVLRAGVQGTKLCQSSTEKIEPVYTGIISEAPATTTLRCFEEQCFGSTGRGDMVRYLPVDYPEVGRGTFSSYKFPQSMKAIEMIGLVLKAPFNHHSRLISSGHCWTLPQIEMVGKAKNFGKDVGVCLDGKWNIFPMVARQPGKCVLFVLSGQKNLNPSVYPLECDQEIPEGSRLLLFERGL